MLVSQTWEFTIADQECNKIEIAKALVAIMASKTGFETLTSSYEMHEKDQNVRDFRFYISANYEFKIQKWKSWWFEIEDDQWNDYGSASYKYPVLFDRLYFFKDRKRLVKNWFSSAHMVIAYSGPKISVTHWK